jgi:hypothetical protein
MLWNFIGNCNRRISGFKFILFRYMVNIQLILLIHSSSSSSSNRGSISISISSTREQLQWSQLLTMAVQVWSQDRSCGIYGGKDNTAAGFLTLLQYLLPIPIPPSASYSLLILLLMLYNHDTDVVIKLAT